MRVYMYTDASTMENDAVGTAILLTKSDCLDVIRKRYVVKSPMEAEFLILYDAINWIMDNGIPCTQLLAYTDCESIVKIFQKYKRTKRLPKDLNNKTVWLALFDSMLNYDATMKHSQGHNYINGSHTVNNSCDIVSKFIMRKINAKEVNL